MNVHLCTENPCPQQDREIADMLKAGFTTEYTNPSNPTGSAPHDRCAWCGMTHAEHDVSRPAGAPVPRVPCGLLVSGFLPKKTP